jgi:hypothetical protein
MSKTDKETRRNFGLWARRNPALREVVVVDPHVDNILKNYSSIFSSVHPVKKTFADFVD